MMDDIQKLRHVEAFLVWLKRMMENRGVGVKWIHPGE